MLKRSHTMVNGKTPTKKSPTESSSHASDDKMWTDYWIHEDYTFNEWNTLHMWCGRLYADTRPSTGWKPSVIDKEMTYSKFEQLLVEMPCLKEKMGTVEFWNDLAKEGGRPYLETKWIDNYEAEVTPYWQMCVAIDSAKHDCLEVEGIPVAHLGNILEARADKTITRLVFEKLIGLCDAVEVDKYGDLKTFSACADCGIGTNGSQLCGKTHCYHLNCRFKRKDSVHSQEWKYERHSRSGKDANFLPVTSIEFTCEVKISGIWYRVHNPKQFTYEKFLFKEIRCKRPSSTDWIYYIVESTSLKSFIEDEKMCAVERFSVSKDKWLSCLNEVIDLTDDDNAQDQKLTKLAAPPSPTKKSPTESSSVPKTPSKPESKKRKAFETPEKDGDKALQCPGAPQRKKQCPGELEQKRRKLLEASCNPVMHQALENMGKDIFEVKQKNKALEERVAKLTNLVSELIGENPENLNDDLWS